MLIEIKDLYKIYNEGKESEVRALDGVSLQIDRGEFELRLEEFRLLYEQQSEQALRENGVATWRLLQFLQSPFPVREKGSGSTWSPTGTPSGQRGWGTSSPPP